MREDLPSGAKLVAERYPEAWSAYARLGEVVALAGPLDDRTRRLVKLALAIGREAEGAVHSHVRRAVASKIPPDELRHVALLGIPMLGLPGAVKALSWIDDILEAE